jgi:hypothetical protein
MNKSKWVKWITPAALLVAGVCASIVLICGLGQATAAAPPPPADQDAEVSAAGDYIVLGWNDLGMHCYNFDFQNLAVLPPYNTLWAQVIKVGDPPQVITTGIEVTYVFMSNTYSAGKSNFWTYAQQLFGLSAPLTPNIGLTGRGLSGTMSVKADHFMAEGIPLTEFSDSAPTTRDPYQLATITVRDANTLAKLAENIVVAPVSTEMHCEYCHADNGRGSEGIATGKVETNILTKHDQEEGTHLMNSQPVLCAGCHSSNALGTPIQPGIPSLSNAMHGQHKEEVPSTLDGCYNCHPGPSTRCLRDVMSQRGMTCINCHGTLAQVAQNPNPWLNEPRCDGCHLNRFQQNNALYRFSTGHGGVYCEGCHDSTHAIAPSTQPRDAIKFIALQGHAGTLDSCTVCHSVMPVGAGPHGILAPTQAGFLFAPDRTSVQEPGASVTYLHTLHNTGSVSDTYTLTWSSSQGWSQVSATLNGGTVVLPGAATLLVDQSLLVTVTVSVPNGTAYLGMVDTTIITATSSVSPTLVGRVTDITVIPSAHIYLPIVMRN